LSVVANLNKKGTRLVRLFMGTSKNSLFPR